MDNGVKIEVFPAAPDRRVWEDITQEVADAARRSWIDEFDADLECNNCDYLIGDHDKITRACPRATTLFESRMLLCDNCGRHAATHTADDRDDSVGYYRTMELCSECDPDLTEAI